MFFGAASAVLYFLDYEYKFLSWIDNWGETVGWSIRGAMVVVGGGLVLFDMFTGKDEYDDGEDEDSPEEQGA